jgi:hypothetical protein
MARPPLPLGTYGRIRAYRRGDGWRARTLYRDWDGATRHVEKHGRTQGAAERALVETLLLRHSPWTSVAEDLRPSFAGSAKVVKNESSLALAGRDQRAYRAWCSLHSATTAHLTCRYALRVKVSIPRRSEWRRSAKQTAGPCVSLLGNRKLTTACLVGLGRSPG